MQSNQLAFALDTFYLLVSGALVMWMAAGFAMLEAGLVRSKNTTEILTKNITLYALACICYLFIGYRLMYGDGGSDTYADAADFFFQSVFVATALSIISGAVAERMKLFSFLLFSIVLAAVLYPLQGAWSWGGGFLSNWGFVDFAGSGIVHLAGAAAALAGVIILGPRTGKYKAGKAQALPGANMPLAALGTFILWLGWFGFNGGSQLQLSGVGNANAIAQIFVNTNIAAATGTLGALIVTKIISKKADLTMILNGALAGLVAITAQPVSPSAELASGIGLAAGALVVFSIITLDKMRLDDPVGALSVHGVCGIFGLLVVPLSDTSATLVQQLTGAAVIFSWMFCSSLLLWWLLHKTIGIRVSKSQEYQGADSVDCGIEAYPEFVSNAPR